MHFSIRKNITVIKQRPLKRLINVIILVISVPVIIIAGISLSLYFVFIWLRDIFFPKKTTDSGEENYYLELDLVHNEHVHIVMIEDEFDTELTQLNEAWQERVYNEETYLYRVRTVPVITALDGSICCFYYKEQYEGLFLQVIPSHNKKNNILVLNSELIFLDYKNFGVTPVDETGPFFLYNDDKNTQLIKGFNKDEKISLELELLDK